MSNEEQCFVLLILQVINFFSFNKCFSKALKGFFFPLLSYLSPVTRISSAPGLFMNVFLVLVLTLLKYIKNNIHVL